VIRLLAEVREKGKGKREKGKERIFDGAYKGANSIRPTAPCFYIIKIDFYFIYARDIAVQN
jgi:hypothetical protein